MEEIFNKDYALEVRNLNLNNIFLKVKAGARQNSIDGWITINDKKYLKISVQSQPIKGKANEMIIEFMAKELKLAKTKLNITKGHTSSFKILQINF